MNFNEISDRYIMRAELSLLKDKLRQSDTLVAIATSQAKLGTWHRNLTTGHLETSERLREIFGFTMDEQLSFDGLISRIHADYRPLVLSLIEQAITTEDDHDIEYPLSVPAKHHTVWIRATGKVKTMHPQGEKLFIGAVMDITEQRDLDQRKQNFIQCLTGNLKTPIIALSSYIQVLEQRLEFNEDAFSTAILLKMQAEISKLNETVSALKDSNHQS
jgi:two-component system CheB/CheR fusion protein